MYNNGFYNGGYYNIQNIDNLPIQDIKYVSGDSNMGTFIVSPNKKTLIINVEKGIASIKFADFNGNVYSREFEFKEKLPEGTQVKNSDFVSKQEFDKLVAIIGELENRLNLTTKSDKGESEKDNK